MAYLLGSIPSAVWIGKIIYGVDVRKKGSGNAGATNTIRVLGPKAGIPVFIIDVLKGLAAVSLIYFFPISQLSANQIGMARVFLGITATLGHIFPLLAGFRGGKGVATLVGTLLGLYPLACPLLLLFFTIVFILTRFISLSSILSALVFPFAVYFVFQVRVPALIIYSVIIAVFIPITHHKNIRRLMRGEEKKFYFRKSV